MLVPLVAAVCAQTFTLVDSGTKSSLRGLAAVSAKVAWAAGTGGTVLRTDDGGQSWTRAGPAAGTAELDFRDVEADGARRAWLLAAGPGAASRLYRTADAGRSWKVVIENHSGGGFWDAIAVWDPRSLILLGDPIDGMFEVRVTRDGGKTWQRPVVLPAARANESAFAASGTCLITGGNGRGWFATGGMGGGRVFRTGDWGRTWQVSETPVAHGSGSQGIFSLGFGDAGLIAVGGDFQKPVEAGYAAISSDGGRSWQTLPPPNHYLSAVIADGRQWIAAGPQGVLRFDGRLWSTPAGSGFHALQRGGRAAVWASGPEGRIGVFRCRNSDRIAPSCFGH